MDATLVTASSDKEGAAPTWKRGYGFHPLGAWLANTRECLAMLLRPGNAGSNTFTDRRKVLAAAIRQAPARFRRKILVRVDGVGASHELVKHLLSLSSARRADDTLQTSVAQVFNERGDGMIIRGGPAHVSRDDRQPHLTAEHAEILLADCLSRYRKEHHTIPARLVLHKSSSYTTAEMNGFRGAADKEHLHSLELLWIPGGEAIRLFRHGQHPPLRCTMLSLDDQRHLLYTHGSVPFYGTYPGLYVRYR